MAMKFDEFYYDRCKNAAIGSIGAPAWHQIGVFRRALVAQQVLMWSLTDDKARHDPDLVSRVYRLWVDDESL